LIFREGDGLYRLSLSTRRFEHRNIRGSRD